MRKDRVAALAVLAGAVTFVLVLPALLRGSSSAKVYEQTTEKRADPTQPSLQYLFLHEEARSEVRGWH